MNESYTHHTLAHARQCPYARHVNGEHVFAPLAACIMYSVMLFRSAPRRLTTQRFTHLVWNTDVRLFNAVILVFLTEARIVDSC